MPLNIRCIPKSTLAIEVEGISPCQLKGLDLKAIGQRLVWQGNQRLPLSELFDVSGSLEQDATIQWSGDLAAVEHIAAKMESGTSIVKGNAGRFAGAGMQGGRLVVQGNADDYLGVELRGGTIVVTGDTGNHAGGTYPGEKFGMNRGKIFIQGSAGDGVGQAMRRGTIAIGGTAGKLAGWNMLAGTIICFEACGPRAGAGMKRGTIVGCGNPAASPKLASPSHMLPTFVPGTNNVVPIFQYLKRWLGDVKTEGKPVFAEAILAKLDQPFRLYHGDTLQGGRGELFLASTTA